MPSVRASDGPDEHDLLPHPPQFARAWLNEAVHDLDQRRFAGAVLAQQRVDLGRIKIEVDGVVGEKIPVFLADADGTQERRGP